MVDCPAQLTSLFKSDGTIIPKNATVRLSRSNEFIAILSILGEGKNSSSIGIPSISSFSPDNNRTLDSTTSAIISGRIDGYASLHAHTMNDPSEWMSIEFKQVDTISKVVINNRVDSAAHIIGCTLTVTVGGVGLLNHMISQANYDARIGNAISFASASVS